MAALSERARAFLQEARFAVLATINKDGTPQLSTMWYLLEGDVIVMNTKAGRVKDRNIRRNPAVSICFEDGYNYIAINGTVEIIDDQQVAQQDALRLAIHYEGEETGRKRYQESFAHDQRVSLHLKCERVFERWG